MDAGKKNKGRREAAVRAGHWADPKEWGPAEWVHRTCLKCCKALETAPWLDAVILTERFGISIAKDHLLAENPL